MSREHAATVKIIPKIQSALPKWSAIFPETNTASSDQEPNMRLRVPKNFPRMFSGTSSEIEADHATPQTALPRFEMKTMTAKSACLVSPIHGNVSVTSHGRALIINVTAMMRRSDQWRCRNSVMGGCRNRQTNGVAASKPIAPSDQPSALTAKPIRNGMLPIVSVSMGTLKHDSIVQYLSERSSSRLRKAFTLRATSRMCTPNAQENANRFSRKQRGSTLRAL